MFKILEHYNLNDLYRVISEYDHQTCVQLSPRPQQQDQQQEQRTTLQSFMGSSVTPIKAIYPVEDPYNADAMRRIAPLAISPTMNFTPSARNSVNFEYFTPRQTQKLLSSTTVRSRGNYPMSGRASLDYTVNFSLEEGEDLSSPSPQVCSMSGTPLKLASPRPGCPEYGASDEEGAFTEAIYDFTLSVVGRDAQGNLYLSVNKDDGWTFLDLFTMNTFEVEQLFCWNETIVITNVSFSASLKLIGISIKRASMPEDAKWIQKNGSSKDTCVYQSFVVCADDPGRTMHPVGDPSLHPQRVQFLFDENTSRKASLSAAPTPTKPVVCSYTSYFLVTTLAQSLIVYNVQARVKKYLVASSMCEETTVHRAPRKETLIAGDHIWSKYELKNKLLYFVSRSTKGSKSKEAPPACVLVRVPMGEARFRASGEWQLSQCFAVPHGVATNLAWDTESPFPYTPRRQLGSSSIVAPLPSVSVVSLGGPGTACLCIQHEFDLHDAEDVLVPISVVHLATQTRIDYSIPVPKRATKAKQFGKLRVLFDAVSDYLLVYIPGVYLHLLDLSLIHNPTAGMAFVGADATPLVPQVLSTDGPDDFYSIAPFPLSQFGGDDRAQNSFLDLCTGTVYDYGYDRKFVVGLVGNNSNGSSTKVDPAKVLHMALMHMQDEEVVEKIIGKVLSTMPELATQSLFKEYILGETFCSLTRTLHPHILSGVPPTAVEQNTFISVKIASALIHLHLLIHIYVHVLF